MSSLRQQIARMFCVGFDGTTVPADTDALLKRGVGSLALFRRNINSPQQFAELSADLKKRAGRPLILGIDQEGGRVMRLRGAFTDVPAMRELGKTADEKLAYQVGQVLARESRAMNIDVIFAPVLDVDTNPLNPVIADRSLSADPEIVAKLGTALIRGIQSSGVAACGKHFPGHGDTWQDSHHILPKMSHGEGRLEAVELPPFRAAIEAGVAAIMTAHVVFEPLDPGVPATMSRKILQEILRDRLGFDGVLISDDLEMQAIIANYGLADAVVQTANAGVDQIMICHSVELQNQAIDELTRAVESGAVPKSRIEQSNRRLDVFCRQYVKTPGNTDLDLIGCASHQAIAERVRSFNGNGNGKHVVAIDPTEQMTRS